MRSPAVLVLTALSLTSTALVHVAEAGPKGGPGGGGKGPHSAPAPHAAAPTHQPRAAAAPIGAAPRVAAPHGPGPGARMAAPHAAAPRIAPPAARQPHELMSPHRMLPPRLATSRAAPGRVSKHPATGRSATAGGSRALKTQRAPTVSSTSRAAERAGKHAVAPSTAQGGRVRGNQPTEGQSAGNPITSHGAAPGKVGPIAQPPIAANSNRDRNANRALRGGTQMQGVANRTPILRNAAFASVPSRNPQSRSLAQSTFRGGFSQARFAGRAHLPDARVRAHQAWRMRVATANRERIAASLSAASPDGDRAAPSGCAKPSCTAFLL